MKQLITITKALSDTNRLRALAALATNDSLCACELLSLLNISGATLSRHMAVLLAAQLVRSEKRGKWVHYSLRRDIPITAPVLQWILEGITDTQQWEIDQQILHRITSSSGPTPCTATASKTVSKVSKAVK